MLDQFVTSRGSIIGPAHIDNDKNNQDGSFLAHNKDFIVGAVCDGCSGGACSEVGARWGAEWLGANVPFWMGNSSISNIGSIVACISHSFSQALQNMLCTVRSDAYAHLPYLVDRFGLFTALGFYMDRYQTIIFALGDGYFGINGENHWLDSEVNSQGAECPEYLGYHLLPSTQEFAKNMSVVFYAETSTIDSLVIASDGVRFIEKNRDQMMKNGKIVDSVDQFMKYPEYVSEKASNKLRQKLRMLQRQRFLYDDTTVITVRRANES